MAIEFNCPTCARKFSVAETQAGQRAKCGGCRGVITVPQSAPRPKAAAPSTPKPAASEHDGDKLRVTCACGRAFQTAATAVGKVGTCDRCGAKFTIAPPPARPRAAADLDLDVLINEGIAHAATAKEVPIYRAPEPQVVEPKRRKRPSPPVLETWYASTAFGLGSFSIMLAVTAITVSLSDNYWDAGARIIGSTVCINSWPAALVSMLQKPNLLTAVVVGSFPFLLIGFALMVAGAEHAPPVPS